MEFRSDMTVELVKHAASDADVLYAARVSTGAKTKAADSADGLSAADSGLINYLMRDKHGSPFEHNSMTFYVEAPIFVVREFVRHRVGFSYNEESGRYKELQPVFYVPADGRPLRQVGKPGAYRFELGTYKQHMAVTGDIRRISQEAYSTYQRLLDLEVAREVARMVLPVNIYSSFYVTCNARSLMNFLSLRTKRDNARFPSSPQEEIAMVADQMESLWSQLMPRTWQAYEDHGRVAP